MSTEIDPIAAADEHPLTLPLPVTVSSGPIPPEPASVTGQNVFSEAPGTAAGSPAHVQFDLGSVSAAHADPEAWGTALAGQIGHLTGVWFAPESLAEVFETYQHQAAQAEAREIAFLVANLAIPSRVEGDAAGQLLKLRSDLTSGLTKRAGI